ncbi:hypothetical protein MCEMIH22_01766 [Candidatus Methylacidiphilaceae bacterium]
MPEGLTIIEIPVTTGMNYPAKLRSSLGFLTQAGRLEVRRKNNFWPEFLFPSKSFVRSEGTGKRHVSLSHDHGGRKTAAV